MKRLNRRKQNRQGAAALTAVLVCTGVIGALVFASMQTSLRQRRQLDRELQMEQTRWLAEAGLGHALKLIETKNELGSDPIVIKPTIRGKTVSEVKIEFTTSDEAVNVSVSAWIGRADRPETQTRQTLNEIVSRQTTNEKLGSTSEEQK